MADHPKTSGSVGIDIQGHDNVVISGDVGRDVFVTIGGRNVRGEEVAYLDGLIDRYRYWAEKYTPLAGIAEVRAATTNGPRLDLPMLFMPAGFEKLEEHGFGEQRRTERVAVDDLRDAVAKYKRLVLLGEPGSGKTTTLWRLAYDLAVAAKEDPKAPLPLLVPLGGYTGPESALAYAQGYFEELGAYLPAYLRSRRLVLLLDALNEMPQSSYKERVGRIQGLLDQHPDISVVVTCRALDYVETLKLEKLEVKALDPERQRAYLHRYLGEVEGERLFWQMARGPAVADLWHTWQGAGVSWDQFWTATEIPEGVYKRTSTSQDVQWRALRKDGLPPLLVLGRNPFMLVMLAQVYAASEGVLPPNRGRLVAAFVDTLLRREERRCDSAQWPSSEALLGAMSRLAYAMQEAGERGTAVEAAWAAQHLEQPGVDAGRIAYLCASATLLDTSNGQVRFVHQLVQEYFAALALVGRLGAGDDLRSYWPRDWTQPSGWEETFILLAGALPDMAPLVDRLLLVHPALAARCVAESGVHQPDKTRTKVVQQRLLALATSVSVSVAQRNAAGNALDHVGDPRPGIGLRADGLPDIAWCTVLGGEFIMGNTGQTDDNAFDNEAPQCQAELPAFQISKYLITNAQFEAFVQDGGYTELWRGCWTGAGWQRKGERIGPDRHGGVFNLPNHPVVMVTWYEAVAFCNWLSQKLGRSISLPSEAQWERVARHTDGRRYPWGDELTSDHANYYETSIDATSAVGIFPKGVSECGALDMSGNVWEWCQTKRRTNYNSLPDDDPEGDARRILRGGSFYLYARYVRGAVRFEDSPNARNRGYGFRVVAASP
jgi:formylglycine-generating enzyme required for sulfatase activity